LNRQNRIDKLTEALFAEGADSTAAAA
jgi:hypothetical protein